MRDTVEEEQSRGSIMNFSEGNVARTSGYDYSIRVEFDQIKI